MLVQRFGIKLREDIYFSQRRIKAVADRNIDKPVFSKQRYRRLTPFFCKRIKSASLPATQDNA